MKNACADTRIPNDTAILSSDGEYTSFEYGDNIIRFATSPKLNKYVEVKTWDNGYIEVLANYGGRLEEEYIDLIPILKNLYIEPDEFLAPIKHVEVSYA